MPWPSEPFTSARVISSAMIFASGAGTWTASKARAMNASRSCALMRLGSGISINLDVVLANDLVPAFRFRSDECGEFLGRSAQADGQCSLRQRALRIQLFHGSDRCRMQPIYDRAWRARRREKPIPVETPDTREARFRHRGHLRHFHKTLLRGNGKRLDLPRT